MLSWLGQPLRNECITCDHGYVVFVIVKRVLSSFMITSRIFNTTGVTHGAGAAYRSEIPELVRLALFILSIESFHDLSSLLRTITHQRRNNFRFNDFICFVRDSCIIYVICIYWRKLVACSISMASDSNTMDVTSAVETASQSEHLNIHRSLVVGFDLFNLHNLSMGYSLFVVLSCFFSTIALSVFQFTVSMYPFTIFKNSLISSFFFTFLLNPV